MTNRKLRLVKKTLVKKPGQSSKTFFQEAHLPEVSKSTRCRLLRNLAKNVQPQKQPPLLLRHKQSRLQWAKKYMKTDMKMALFTDETRATLGGPDGWGKGWVANGQQRHNRFRRQQGGGGVMIWAGIIGGKFLGPI